MDDVSNQDFDGALVIVCDTDHHANIEDKRYKLGDYIIKIHHHPNSDVYGNTNWINPEASSVCEMIYELYEFGTLWGYYLTKEAAYLLYAGIVGDTGRFMYPNTTEKTFYISGKLLSYGVSRDKLYTQLTKTELSTVRLKGYILQHFQMTSSGVGFIKLHPMIIDQLGQLLSTRFN